MSQLALYASIALLIVTLLVGPEVNSARRWLQIPGIGVSFQSSDLAKIALVAWVARMLDKNRLILQDFKEGLWPILRMIGVVCFLILLADFSTAAMLAAVCLLLMVIAGVPWGQLAKAGGLTAAIGILILAAGSAVPGLIPRLDTIRARLLAFSGGEGGSLGERESRSLYLGETRRGRNRSGRCKTQDGKKGVKGCERLR